MTAGSAVAERWQTLPFFCESPFETMERDRTLLKNFTHPILRFYRWSQPALSFGRTQGIQPAAEQDALQKGWMAVQRPTGGGMVEHGKDLCFTIIWSKDTQALPWKVKNSYLAIHAWVQKSLKDLGINSEILHNNPGADSGWCFQSPVCSDLVSEGSKIVGGAQWREKNLALHQGSIQLNLGEESLPVFIKNFSESFHVFI